MQYPMDNPVSFLANENFPRKSIIILRQAGYQMVSVSEKMPGAKDESVLRLASDNKYIILTFDRDYGELIYRYRATVPAGIIYFRFNPSSPDEPAQILINILNNKSIQIAGKFTIIERERLRQRNL